MRAGQILGQPAIPDLGEAPQLLDDAKGMLAPSSVRERARLISFQRALSGALELGRRLIR